MHRQGVEPLPYKDCAFPVNDSGTVGALLAAP